MEARTEKSELTRAAIVDAALELAADNGLDAVSINDVAQKLGMSKSGVFSRVGSREALQLAVLQEYADRVTREVFVPGMREPRGLPRLDAFLRNWQAFIQRSAQGCGCLFVSGAFEFDDRPDSPLKEAIREGTLRLRAALRRTIIQAADEGQLQAGTDPEQLVFEIHSLMIGVMHDLRFLREPRAASRIATAYHRLIDSYRAAGTAQTAGQRH
jgi:AcrR family transcriptional regulator